MDLGTTRREQEKVLESRQCLRESLLLPDSVPRLGVGGRISTEQQRERDSWPHQSPSDKCGIKAAQTQDLMDSVAWTRGHLSGDGMGRRWMMASMHQVRTGDLTRAFPPAWQSKDLESGRNWSNGKKTLFCASRALGMVSGAHLQSERSMPLLSLWWILGWH